MSVPPMNRRAIQTVLAAWLLMVGFDVFLHAGILARLYAQASPFLLPAELAFRRIPLGYTAFLVLAGALYWILARLDIRDWLSGVRFGLAAGLVVWGALSLGLYSISTAEPALLLGWWLGQAFELGLAGAVIGRSLEGVAMRGLYKKVGVAVFFMIVAVVLLQSFGLAPAMQVR